ncbi:MAG: hypothetical protein NWT00_04515 [Beijerinckiaceae bacterium]|jgi:hypothetical protein|nr:hypothetical protein [Beijerinckiaceae bacterium]
MRKTMFLALLVLTGLASPVISQSVSLDGIARSVSLFAKLAKHCPSANVIIAARYGMAFNDVGTKNYGKARFDREVAKEMTRRENEVLQTGKAEWCEKQIAGAERLGLKNIRGKR